jgi:hypothetical protein
MDSATNFALKDPRDRVIGFRLDVDTLGHEIYDLLDYADEHFDAHVVEQTDDHVFVWSEAARERWSKNQISAQPLSLDNEDSSDGSDPGLLGGGGGGGSTGTSPTPGGGGGSTTKTVGR